MQTVSVTFERIFDIHRWESSQNSPRHTTFGFVAGGKSYYAVSVPDWPTIEAGTTITAFLREEGNWQSVVGWINQQTNEIATPNYRRSFIFAVISGILALLGCIGFFGAGSTISTLAGKAFAAIYVFLLTLVAIVLAKQGYRQQREAEFIKAFSAEALNARARD
jgi:hypothetical protein